MRGVVYVVDDDESVRKAIMRLLRSLECQARGYESGEQLLDTTFEGPEPGCILLDLRMSGLTGLDVLDSLAARDHPPIVMVSGHGDVSTCASAMKRGACDFLEKPVHAAQLRSVIVKAFMEDIAAQSARRITNTCNAHIATLTPRERVVLQYVISGRLNKVTAEDLGISEKTIKVHRARILQKMQVRSVAELTRICTLIGIRPADPSPSFSLSMTNARALALSDAAT